MLRANLLLWSQSLRASNFIPKYITAFQTWDVRPKCASPAQKLTCFDQSRAIEIFGMQNAELDRVQNEDLVRVREELKLQANQIADQKLKDLKLTQINRSYDAMCEVIRKHKIFCRIAMAVVLPPATLFFGLITIGMFM